jgi:hypothetical protein
MAPLYAWRVTLRMRVDTVAAIDVDDLRHQLERYDADVELRDEAVIAVMTILGHVGPASAFGDAAQWFGYAATSSGLRGVQIDAVWAVRTWIGGARAGTA